MRATIGEQSDFATRNHLEIVLKNELELLQKRIMETGKGQFIFHVTSWAGEFLLLNGAEPGCNAERLKLAIERYIVYPLANLFAADQIRTGDTIRIDWDHSQDRLNFAREVDDLGTPLDRFELEAFAGSIPAHGGELVEAFAA